MKASVYSTLLDVENNTPSESLFTNSDYMFTQPFDEDTAFGSSFAFIIYD